MNKHYRAKSILNYRHDLAVRLQHLLKQNEVSNNWDLVSTFYV